MQTLPPEWAPQQAVQLTWPSPAGDFSRHFAAVEQTFIQLAVAIGRFQDVLIAHGGSVAELRERLLAEGLPAERLRVFEVPSNDVWARDHGPITVIRDGERVHLDFQFNGWGGKFKSDLDNQLTRRLAELGAWPAPVETTDFVLEGGGIETDGAGTLLTTERCLLAATRNPQLDKEQVELRLQGWFGVDRVLWLRHGELIGDDTDGHVDTLARFVDSRTIAYQACDDAQDAHFGALRAMQRELQKLRRGDKRAYQLVPLPLPKPMFDEDGRRLPAGYANFLIINGAVLVPVYRDSADETALSRLQAVFKDREVLPIDCRALIRQYGSLHCVTMQIPAAPRQGTSD